jgi:hypothetical protein
MFAKILCVCVCIYLLRLYLIFWYVRTHPGHAHIYKEQEIVVLVYQTNSESRVLVRAPFVSPGPKAEMSKRLSLTYTDNVNIKISNGFPNLTVPAGQITQQKISAILGLNNQIVRKIFAAVTPQPDFSSSPQVPSNQNLQFTPIHTANICSLYSFFVQYLALSFGTRHKILASQLCRSGAFSSVFSSSKEECNVG